MLVFVKFLLVRAIPIVLGGLSFAFILWRGLDLDLAGLVAAMLDKFDTVLMQTVGVLGGLIAKLFQSWSWFDGFTLDENWRHVASLSYLYFVRDFENFRGYGQLPMIFASCISGFVALLIFPMLGGLLGSEEGSYPQAFVFGLFPLLGFLFYGVVVTAVGGFVSRPQINRVRGLSMGFGDYVLSRWRLWGERVMVGVILLGVLLWPARDVLDAALPATLVLVILWIVLALEWLRRGVPQGLAEARQQGLPTTKGLMANGNVNLGANMLMAVGFGMVTITLGLLG